MTRRSDAARRQSPWLLLLVIALGVAVAFMGWSLWSRSRDAMRGAAVAISSAPTLPDIPIPQLPGAPPTIPDHPPPIPR